MLIEHYYVLSYPLLSALCSLLVAQGIKIVSSLFINHNLNLKQAFESGGMPSSHSAMVISLATSIGVQEGFFSPLFAISAIFSLVVLYDAAGVRRAVGNQAALLNQIIDDLVAQGRFKREKLQELIGHTPLEVIFGVFLGIGIALFLNP